MRYQIKIENAQEDNGKIDLRRLALLAESINNIAEGSLNIRLTGLSFPRCRKTKSIMDSLTIDLVGVHNGSTILDLECEIFGNKLRTIEPDLFTQGIYENLMKSTPMELVINSFADSLDEKASKEFIDKSLLTQLKDFGNIFNTPEEKMTIFNQGSIPGITLVKKDFEKIEILEKETPEQHSTIINGKIDVLEYSKTRAKIITNDGIVDAYIGESVSPDEMRNFWGKEATIYGTANYKPGGNLKSIEIERIFEPGRGDEYFSFKTESETTEQQIERQLKERKNKNTFGNIIGKWPGEESLEDLLKMLTK